MVERVEVAEVVLWDHAIGAVAWDAARELGTFEYTEDFRRSGIQVAPLTMPLGPALYRFPALERETFRGLPGLLADALPDRFGNAVIRRWLAREGRDPASFSPVEQLCYTGTRAMGALEFRPALGGNEPSEPIAIGALVDLAREVLEERESLDVALEGEEGSSAALNTILRVGTSAGGARAKAVIAWNPKTNEVRSGQVSAPDGFESWLLKFDGVDGPDRELRETRGYGRIEYAYSLMARAAGIEMSPCDLFEEHGRAHFMTKRFDRGPAGEKRHLQSLCALGHMDFYHAGAHSYEEVMQIIQRLQMPARDLVEQFRRMVFNVILRNQDDHTKNIAFLMDRRGRWSLAPAYDVTYAYNPEGRWTARHQMSIAGKREGFTVDDLLGVAKLFGIRAAGAVVDEVRSAALQWRDYAQKAGVDEEIVDALAAAHRCELQ